MKTLKIIVTLSLIVGFTFNKVFAQQKVAVAIAKKETSCGSSTDLGYYWYSSPSQKIYELKSEAKKSAENKYSDYESIESKVAYSGCTYMIIISARISKNGCTITTYGVGFANDKSSALDQAIRHLTGRNWSWKKSDGYTIAEEKFF
ncbi:MAG TPA: hypothetical protein ENK75_05510 [Saprospiraceae bacterium]|nr:hypothetical protein [Saprospiraceae bacterium]